MITVESVAKKIGRRYLKIYSDFMPQSRAELYERQTKNFLRFRSELAGTEISEALKLKYIRNYTEYVEHIPVWNFEDYAPFVERAIQGHKDVMFKGEVSYVGLSSGTSGKNSKRVPYNERMINLFVKSQRRVASRLSKLENQINILDVSRLTFGSDPYLYSDHGIKHGYISGILGTRVPKALKKSTFPSAAILNVSEWDQKINMLIDEALNEDIQIISGIPTYLISILEAVLERTGKKEIREIWPNLRLFVYAATPIKQYQERIDRLVGHEVSYYGLYASTEAPIGLPFDAFDGKTQRYFLNPDLLYSFTSVENPKLRHGIQNLRLNTPYYLNVGTPNGFIHYAMKDVVTFTEVDGDLVFEFVGRKNTGMNLAAEKVSDDQILDTVIKTQTKANIDIRHFFLSPSTEAGKTSYHWTLFVSDEVNECTKKLGKIMDDTMSELNPDYMDCREVNVLAEAQVRLMNSGNLQAYFEKNRDRGQFKMKTTFETAEEYLDFMHNNFPAPTEVLQ
jgi:GH3 auxin-responsive promoter.